MNPSLTSSVDINRIEEFLANEANLLDERRFEEWMALFVADGYYWAPTAIDQHDPSNTVSLIYDDLDAMQTRIRRLRHPRIHAQTPPSRTARIVGNPVVESRSSDGSELLVRSKFILYEYRPSLPDAIERVFGGTYRHCLISSESSFKISMKKALLANCDGRLSPVSVYF
jgi:3-phenylpropionate/cinnamic acid dioxygenase small subunit